MTSPEIIPAETIQAEQPIVGSHCWLAIPLAFALGVLLTLVGANTL